MENNSKDNHSAETDGEPYASDFALDLIGILANYEKTPASSQPFLVENEIKIVL